MKEYFEIPNTCPECGFPAEIKGAYLMCTNDLCSGLGTGNLERWVKTLGIDDFGPKLIQMLYEKEMAKEPADLYKLTESQIANLDRMGEKSAAKILKNLRAKMQITLPELIAGLNIPNFGSSRTELLMAAGIDDVVKIFNATESDLVQVKGIETTTACQITQGIRAKANIIKRLFEVGITIKKPEAVKIDSNKLAGKSFCFTGSIQKIKPDGKRFTREDMQKLVVINGGNAEDSVRKGLTYLVMADPSSTSSKTKKAKELDVALLSEADFFKMVQ
jgi:DNA ligase (NAD+)